MKKLSPPHHKKKKGDGVEGGGDGGELSTDSHSKWANGLQVKVLCILLSPVLQYQK